MIEAYLPAFRTQWQSTFFEIFRLPLKCPLLCGVLCLPIHLLLFWRMASLCALFTNSFGAVCWQKPHLVRTIVDSELSRKNELYEAEAGSLVWC